MKLKLKADATLVIWIILFISGFLLGTISQMPSIPEWVYVALATITAAFAGSWLSYKLQREREESKQVDKNLIAANRALFELSRILNDLMVFQADFVEPARGNPMRYLAIPATLPLDRDRYDIDLRSLSFLFASGDVALLSRVSVAFDGYVTAIDSINDRSKLRRERVQPKIDDAGITHGMSITEPMVRSALGNELHAEIYSGTENMIEHLDKCVALFKFEFQELRKTMKDALNNDRLVDLTF